MYLKLMLMMVAATLLAACACDGSEMPAAAPVVAAVAPPQAEAVAVTEAVAAPPADAQLSPDLPASSMAGATGITRCRQQEDVRTLATRQEQDGRWLVLYENDGVSHAIPGRLGTLEEASRLFERLKKNLIASGFHCE